MHICKLPSGNWRVIVKHQGDRATGSAPTRVAAQVLGAQLLLDLGARQSAQHISVGDLLDGHLARVEWSPTTLDDAERAVRQLPEAFRQRMVPEVNGAILAGLYRQLLNLGWSPHRIRRVHFVISTAWGEAITWGWATSNPARHVKLPKVRPRNIHPPDTEQVRAVLAETSGTFATYARLAALSGGRRGELVALQWSDVDLETGRTLIARSLVQVKGAPVERDTKTSTRGHRVIIVDELTLNGLRRLYEAQVAMAVDWAPRWVFSHDAGHTPWRPDHPSRLFRQACDRAGVDGVRLHDLRHYVVTSMLQDGVEPVDVAAQVGHASVATTLNIYAHYMPGRGRESVNRRAARLDG